MQASREVRILLVDDDPQSLDSTRKILELAGFEVLCARDGQEALARVQQPEGGPLHLVLSDVRMPRMGGIEFIRALRVVENQIPVVLMTAYGKVEDAVWAMKLGAVDFLSKPFRRAALLEAVDQALKRSLRGARAASTKSTDLLGQSLTMRELRAMIERVAPTQATVLITGESGTGKELVARRLHEQSARASGAFVAINCAAVPETLMEAELFGWERGAFTGATHAREGLFEQATGGTLFLDEIGDMPLALQAKLLRALQEGEVRRLGATESKKVDVRVVAATHQELKARVAQGLFREDLLYRLEVIALQIKPLRARPEDIPDLAYAFLNAVSARHGVSLQGIDEAVMEALLAHAWPGNVRELANVIERAVVLGNGPTLSLDTLPEHLRSGAVAARAVRVAIEVPVGTSLKDAEDLLIAKTLEATAGDKTMTAKILGVNPRTIYRWLESREMEQV